MKKLDSKCKLVTSAFFALFAFTIFSPDALAKALYVSPDGDGTTAKTWKTAWKSLVEIDWDKVSSGDTIFVDGGVDGITYEGAVVIPKSNIVIRQSRHRRHRGQVIISGPNPWQGAPVATGITFNGNNVHLIGNKRSGIKVQRFSARLVLMQSNYCSMRNVELAGVSGYPPYGSGRVACLEYCGFYNRVYNCDFRDNTRNAVEKSLPSKRNLTVFRNCTFGNKGYGYWGEFGMGIVGADNPNSRTYVSRCVIGPYFTRGIHFKEGTLVVSNSIFLGAHNSNLHFGPQSGSNAKVRVNRCTFFESNLTGHSIYPYSLNQIATNGKGTMKVYNSIVYGGVVSVPAGSSINGGGNIQFRVSGNTQALANDLTDPQFVEDAKLSEEVTATTIRPVNWTSTSFAVAKGSPATGKGSTIKNVSDLVSPYGPTRGLPTHFGGP